MRKNERKTTRVKIAAFAYRSSICKWVLKYVPNGHPLTQVTRVLSIAPRGSHVAGDMWHPNVEILYRVRYALSAMETMGCWVNATMFQSNWPGVPTHLQKYVYTFSLELASEPKFGAPFSWGYEKLMLFTLTRCGYVTLIWHHAFERDHAQMRLS